MVVVRAMEHTGMDLAGWLTPAILRDGAAPKSAAEGPLKGHRIAILGSPGMDRWHSAWPATERG